MNITRRKQVLLALGVAALAGLAIVPFGAFATGPGADAPDPAPAQPRTPGALTHDEYAAAAFTNMACLDAQGIAHSDPVYDPQRERYTYTVTTAAPGGADSPVESCWRLHERDVAAQWAMEHPERVT